MKVSVIGTGFGLRVFAPAYTELGLEVEVASARDPDAVRRACAAPVDFVSIHSPPFLHREHVLLALAHGHHILCDKPFGRSTTESREMLQAQQPLTFDKDAGGGWIRAYGAHVIDTMRWIFGEIAVGQSVCRTEIATRITREGKTAQCSAEDAFTAAIVFESGVTAMIDSAFGVPEYRPSRSKC